MSLPDATHVRLSGLEDAVKQMSDRVGAMAEFVQRLVVLEERNSYVTEQVREVRETCKELVNKLTAKNEDLEHQIRDVRESVVRLVTICTVSSSLIATIAPHLLKKFLGI